MCGCAGVRVEDGVEVLVDVSTSGDICVNVCECVWV